MKIDELIKKQKAQEDRYSKLIKDVVDETIIKVGFKNKRKLKKAIRAKLAKISPALIGASTKLGLDWIDKNGFNPEDTTD